jgi:ribosomal protein L25 (general stress protein Ctc)
MSGFVGFASARRERATITFGKLPRLVYGEECNGADIVLRGESVGRIFREVNWVAASATSRKLEAKITGYTVMVFRSTKAEKTFETLADARAYARSEFAPKEVQSP